MLLGLLSITALLARAAQCVNFPWESVQLNSSHTDAFPDIDFGNRSTLPGVETDASGCKAFPGSAKWPTEEEWGRVNKTIDGVLLKPLPAGAVCYPGPAHDEERCQYVVRLAGATRFYLDDPLASLTQWTEGTSCPALSNPRVSRNCTQGGFPLYVVNATNVKHIQAAINFARNRNIRLVIK